MAIIYVDESGDLGWNFTKPYRQGGSSRHLTIAAAMVARPKKHLPKRLVKDLSKRLGASSSEEVKWSSIDPTTRLWFAGQMASLKRQMGSDLKLLTMTVKKEHVMPHIRADANKLYNYMLNLLLCHEMAQHPAIDLIPDQRAVRVASGNSMGDYLQTVLWFEKSATTNLTTTPMDSRNCAGLQFADMLSGMVQSNFEDNNPSYLQALGTSVFTKKLFFQ